MIIEVSTRRSGRTTRAVEWMKSNGKHFLIVTNEYHKKWIQRQPIYNLNDEEKQRIYTYNDFDNGLRGRNLGEDAKLFIDDLNIFLGRGCIWQIAGFNIATDG